MRDFLGWSVIIVDNNDTTQHQQWCLETLLADTWQYESWLDIFSFKHDSDVVAFKLKFGL